MSTLSTPSIRTITTILYPTSSNPRWNNLVHKRLSPSSSLNKWPLKLPLYSYNSRDSVKIIGIFTPLCMGRRFVRLLLESVKKGGPNPASNHLLALILEKAKELDVPKEIIERNIKKASEKEQESYIEKTYEVYGYGGVGFVVEVLTDKVTRSVAFIREVVKDCGGKMVDPGSVMFRFRRAYIVNVKASDADKDQLLEIALDAGAEEVTERPDDVDGSEEDQSERYYKIVCEPENYSAILSKLRDERIKFETDNGLGLLPINPIEVDDEAMELNKELMSRLLELDDVDAVYTDQKSGLIKLLIYLHSQCFALFWHYQVRALLVKNPLAK